MTIRKLLFVALCCMGAIFPTKAFAQDLSNTYDKRVSLNLKPQSYIFGANLGADFPISPKLALGGEISVHLRIGEPNMAIKPSLKYYFSGGHDDGVYARFKLIGGYYFSECAVDDDPYYAGGGISIGSMTPMFKSKHLFFFAEVGLQVAPTFGYRANNVKMDGDLGGVYHGLLSPGALPDVSLGIAFKF